MNMAAKKHRGYEKAAIFLMSIGEDAAAEIMKNLEAKDIHKIARVMPRLENLLVAEIDEVIGEFHESFGEGRVHGGEDYMKTVLAKAVGNEKAKTILDKVGADDEGALETLKWLDAKTIANFAKGEHPQTVAIILAHLEPDHAASVISVLPEYMRSDVMLRVATLESVQPEMLRELDTALQGAISTRASHSSSIAGGVNAVALILNNLDSATEGSLMGDIEGINPDLAAQIQKLMFVFSDAVDIDDRGIQMILKEVGNDELVLALKTAGDDLKNKILKNMSERAAQMLREDMETLGPVKLSDVEKAQQNILKIIRRLEQEGKIVIGGKGGEELVL